jgi:hypothetical protein
VNGHERAGSILDDGAEGAIPEEERESVAQALFIHGLLLARRPRPAARARTPWRAIASIAALLTLAAAAFLFLTGDSLPTAHAAVEQTQKVLEQPVDLQFTGTTFTQDGRELRRVNALWSLRADRWAVSVDTLLGTFWAGGDSTRTWFVGPRGRILQQAPLELDPTLLQSNLRDALRDLRAAFDLENVGRETVAGRPVLHVRGARLATTRGPRAIDLWTDLESSRPLRVELHFERGRHVLEFRGAEPRPDDFYEPSGHTR